MDNGSEMMRYAVVHQQNGLFVGVSLGFAFFARCDAVGQPAAPTFDNEEEAMTFIEQILDQGAGQGFEEYSLHPVECNSVHATIAELKAAGLEPHMGDMEKDHLRFLPVAGHA